jgi:hypothetical protein
MELMTRYRMPCRIYEVIMKIISKRTSNQSSKPHGSIDENLIGVCKNVCSLDKKEIEKHLLSSINSMVVQIIS